MLSTRGLRGGAPWHARSVPKALEKEGEGRREGRKEGEGRSGVGVGPRGAAGEGARDAGAGSLSTSSSISDQRKAGMLAKARRPGEGRMPTVAGSGAKRRNARAPSGDLDPLQGSTPDLDRFESVCDLDLFDACSLNRNRKRKWKTD